MSQKNLEVVRRALEAFPRGDLGDRVLVLGRVRARGRESGVELDSPLGWVFTVRGGKLAKAEGFLSRAQALEAAGLSE
jgi:ketosteroid isomerase-like protein